MRRRLPAIRNALILAALATLGALWREGLGATSTALNQIVLVLMLAALATIGFRYFKENRLKWLVIKPWLRAVVAACAVGIVVLAVAGPSLLGDRISLAGVWALIAVLALVIVWIVVQSRKYP